MRRSRIGVLLGIAWGLAGAVPCSGALRLADVGGHLAIGFTHLASSDTTATPAGTVTAPALIELLLGVAPVQLQVPSA